MPTPRFVVRSVSLLLAVSCAALTGPALANAVSPIALGVNLPDSAGDLPAMQAYARQVGANPAIVMWYQQWSEPLSYSSQLPNTQSTGAVPMITWDPYANGVGIPLSQIVAGQSDRYIKASADAAAAWGKPMYIRLGHEMNLSGSGFQQGVPGDTPAEFVDFWRHVVTIFRQEHATNVEWVWSPNVDCAGACPFAAYYPGDAWVDWVALDGYNYAAVDGVPWMTFDQVFGSSYAELSSLTSKPMMIAETASAEQGGDKAQWIAQTYARISTAYPRVHAVVWFNRVKETDWTVSSSAASLAAFRAVVASPTYSGSASSLLSILPTGSDVNTGGPDVASPPVLPVVPVVSPPAPPVEPIVSPTTLPVVPSRNGSTLALTPVGGISGSSGRAAVAKVTLGRASVAASGISTMKVTVRLTDPGGSPVSGNSVALSCSDRGATFGRLTDNGNGTYTARLTASPAARSSNVTARDLSVSPNVTGTVVFKRARTPPAAVASRHRHIRVQGRPGLQGRARTGMKAARHPRRHRVRRLN